MKPHFSCGLLDPGADLRNYDLYLLYVLTRTRTRGDRKDTARVLGVTLRWSQK
jgi:hypothetical protein